MAESTSTSAQAQVLQESPAAYVTAPEETTPSHARFTWSFDRYVQAAEAGLLGDKRTELIDGEIIEKMTISSEHTYVTTKISNYFNKHTSETEHTVISQGTVRLTQTYAPEPDVMICIGDLAKFKNNYPTSSDLLLIVEVADSSLHTDRTVKLPRYAESGLPELWIANLKTNELERYTDPRSDGTYASKTVIALEGTLTHELLGEVKVKDLIE